MNEVEALLDDTLAQETIVFGVECSESQSVVEFVSHLFNDLYVT